MVKMKIIKLNLFLKACILTQFDKCYLCLLCKIIILLGNFMNTVLLLGIIEKIQYPQWSSDTSIGFGVGVGVGVHKC